MSANYWNRIYCGPPPLPEEIWTDWNFDPLVVVPLALLAVLSRSNVWGLGAVFVLSIAFISPLCALSSALFSARSAHHVLLTAVAAPLFAQSRPTASPTSMALPLALSTVVFWSWHVPTLYNAALSNIALYWAMQLSILASSIWFWRELLSPKRQPIDAMIYLVLGFAQMGMLGALLAFAPAPLYSAHMSTPFQWGTTPLVDQQLGGLIMWVPAALPFMIIGIVIARSAWRVENAGSP